MNPLEQPKTPLRIFGRALLRGLIVAAVCVFVVAALAAIWGGVFGFHPGATIYGQADPGLEGATMMAVFFAIFLGSPLALVGFVAGFVYSLLRS